MRHILIYVASVSFTAASIAAEPAASSASSPRWCAPDGPRFAQRLAADNHLMFKPGWVTLRMHVQPGALPVSNVRVVSEAGGPMHARNWLPLVRQWIGCASNEREADFQIKFTHGYEGSYQLPAKEGFGPYAFMEPRGTPQLPEGDWGVGVCPIKATLLLQQPESPNAIIELESMGGAPVREWLTGLVPDRGYMTPNPKGNRIEFNCRVDKGEISFYEH